MTFDTISATFLREPRDPGELIPLRADQALMLADALEIADVEARVEIECNCKRVVNGWWDTSDLDPYEDYEKQMIAQAVRYLAARGLIERQAGAEHLVRVLDAPLAQVK